MNIDFLRDMEMVMSGDRPLSFAMNSPYNDFPYGPKEKKAYNRINKLMKSNPNFSVDDFNTILREYQLDSTK